MFPFPFWLVPLGFFLVLMAVFGVGPMSSTRRGGALPMFGVIIVMGIVVLAVVVWQRRTQKRTDKIRIAEDPGGDPWATRRHRQRYPQPGRRSPGRRQR
jgi:hypothetical protein